MKCSCPLYWSCVTIFIKVHEKIMRISQISKFFTHLLTKWKYILIFFMCICIFIFFFNGKYELESVNFIPHMRYYGGVMNGYLVNSTKCHLPSIDPMHPDIAEFVKKIEFKSCTKLPLLTSIVKDNNEIFYLVINTTVAKFYVNITCCWAPIYRPKITEPLIKNWDSIIDEGNCTDFEEKIQLPLNLEIVMVSCRNNEEKTKILYNNIHPIINPTKILNYKNISQLNDKNYYRDRKKMSILILGIDSVSRLNFIRSLPKTEKYLRNNGWLNLNGYNKIGDNTFPNLMAILTGQNDSTASTICKPSEAYGLDNCPFLWYNYKKAGYVTAYGEDWVDSATFNLQKVGFVNPPTDYYLRPYIVATEKLLKSKQKIGSIMTCTGPEPAVNRIYNYASNFAKKFLHIPYFGFFWTNSVSHDDLNGISSMDNYFLNYFKDLQNHGVFNDTLVIFLSDHGMRFGEFRKTFVGWYEERLPFIYLRVPQGYHRSTKIFQALEINKNRLTSPYDLYETLRDELIQSGGDANSSSSCLTCQTLFQPISNERSCEDAGVSSHWCTCAISKTNNEITNETIAKLSIDEFLIYIETIIMQYKDIKGERLCAKLHLKKIHYINEIIEINDNIQMTNKKYSLRIEVIPGSGIFEFLTYANQNGSIKVHPDEISRINSYANDAKCLDKGYKKYCYCLN